MQHQEDKTRLTSLNKSFPNSCVKPVTFLLCQTFALLFHNLWPIFFITAGKRLCSYARDKWLCCDAAHLALWKVPSQLYIHKLGAEGFVSDTVTRLKPELHFRRRRPPPFTLAQGQHLLISTTEEQEMLFNQGLEHNSHSVLELKLGLNLVNHPTQKETCTFLRLSVGCFLLSPLFSRFEQMYR